LLTRELLAGISPDGEFYAGENADGRLERWLARDLERRRK
jgi:hypothetical protein